MAPGGYGRTAVRGSVLPGGVQHFTRNGQGWRSGAEGRGGGVDRRAGWGWRSTGRSARPRSGEEGDIPVRGLGSDTDGKRSTERRGPKGTAGRATTRGTPRVFFRGPLGTVRSTPNTRTRRFSRCDRHSPARRHPVVPRRSPRGVKARCGRARGALFSRANPRRTGSRPVAITSGSWTTSRRRAPCAPPVHQGVPRCGSGRFRDVNAGSAPRALPGIPRTSAIRAGTALRRGLRAFRPGHRAPHRAPTVNGFPNGRPVSPLRAKEPRRFGHPGDRAPRAQGAGRSCGERGVKSRRRAGPGHGECGRRAPPKVGGTAHNSADERELLVRRGAPGATRTHTGRIWNLVRVRALPIRARHSICRVEYDRSAKRPRRRTANRAGTPRSAPDCVTLTRSPRGGLLHRVTARFVKATQRAKPASVTALPHRCGNGHATRSGFRTRVLFAWVIPLAQTGRTPTGKMHRAVCPDWV
ncbi:hypothetical protein Amir_5553 [Actinosynnema mirum DSM 43827]|uniref:Uncharacterized protein n=1 Tax=Actinosynnema mirum (strain ATCC 29888 / DSM 43827 / JCM 3225 / NBRC 14064 / NCIMB 13271 / NRRL B-12336 / IMRU 3971 / 101) TaxID=446462 RepID=C6WB80_ACTMD|nr:hypothetical protein Amir_5553 [Actinosynnema mirum DSM 43827]